MAADKEPSVADCMTAISELAKQFSAYAAANPPPKKDADGDTDGDTGKEAAKKMAAAAAETNGKLAALTETLASLKQEQAALGLKVTALPAAGEAAAETERQRLAAEKAKEGKTYLALVEDEKSAHAADISAGKLKASDCHRLVMSSHPVKYAEHCKNLGIYDAAKDPSRKVA